MQQYGRESLDALRETPGTLSVVRGDGFRGDELAFVLLNNPQERPSEFTPEVVSIWLQGKLPSHYRRPPRGVTEWVLRLLGVQRVYPEHGGVHLTVDRVEVVKTRVR